MSGNVPVPPPFGAPPPGRASGEPEPTAMMPPMSGSNGWPGQPPAVPVGQSASGQGQWSPVAADAQAWPPAGPTQQPVAAQGSAAASRSVPGTAARPSGGSEHPPPARNRLEWPWILFILVDIALVAIAIFMIVSAVGAGGDNSPDPQASEAPLAGSTPTTPTGSASTGSVVAETFATPSRNIACEMSTESVTCTIAQLNSPPAEVSSCNGTVGYKVTLTADGPVLPCVPSAEQPGAAGPSVTELAYDQSRTAGNYECTSTKNGVTCRDTTTQAGFTVSKAGIKTT